MTTTKKYLYTTLLILSLLAYGALVTFAASGPYAPGTTLDPVADNPGDCTGPTDPTCTVAITATPAGADTQIQFNDNGALGASANFIYEDNTSFLAGVTTTNSYEAQSSVGPIDIGLGMPLEGVANIMNDGTDEYAFNAILDGTGLGGSGYLAFNGTNNNASGAQAVLLASSDGSLFGQSGPTLSLSATDGSKYEGFLFMNPNSVALVFDSETTRTAIDLNDTRIGFNGPSSETGESIFKFKNDKADSMLEVSDNGVITFNEAYSFPTTDGTNGQVLTTDGSGNLGFGIAGGVVEVTNNTIYSAGLTNTGTGASAAYGSGTPGNIIFGSDAASGATNTTGAIYIGEAAGENAANANNATYIGHYAGEDSDQGDSSNFIGYEAGNGAVQANYSNFIGSEAGKGAVNAAQSIFIGAQAGLNDTVVNDGYFSTDDYSILLGNETSTGGFSNSIAIGQLATNTAENQFMIGSVTRPIDETVILGSGVTECTITTGTGIACSSDETLKKNITDINTSDALEKLQNIRAVTYNWKNGSSEDQIGFLAQNLEQQYPELVRTNSTGMKSVFYSQITPILVAAIQDLSQQISNGAVDIIDGVRDLVVRTLTADKGQFNDEVCIGDTCVDEALLQQMISDYHNDSSSQTKTSTSNSTTTESSTDEEPAETNTDDESTTNADTDESTTNTPATEETTTEESTETIEEEPVTEESTDTEPTAEESVIEESAEGSVGESAIEESTEIEIEISPEA